MAYKTLTLDCKMPYGQYKDQLIDDIVDKDANYLLFCSKEHDLQFDNEAWAAITTAVGE